MKPIQLALLLFLFISVVAAGQPVSVTPRDFSQALIDARNAYDIHEYRQAISILESALDSATPGRNISDGLYLLTKSSYEAGRFGPTLFSGDRFLADYPADPRHFEIYYLSGVAAFEQDDRKGAEARFRSVLNHETQVSGDSTFLLQRSAYWLARIAAERNQMDSAIHLATVSLSGNGGHAHEFSPDALYLLGWLKEGKNELDTAATLYGQLLSDYPKNQLALDAQLRLGVIQARKGAYAPAFTLLNSLTPRSERQREEQVFYLAEASSALHHDDVALGFYQQHLSGFPESKRNRSARYGAGWSLQELGRWDEAVATYRQLSDGLDSIAAASSYQIGAIQTLRGDTAGAVRTFESLVYRLPYESFSDNAYYQLGRIHYRKRNFDSAAHYLNIAAREFPNSDVRVESYYLLGESYYATGALRNAQFTFQKTRKVGSTGEFFQRALFREGVTLYKLGQFRSAIERLREYVADTSGADYPDALFWLGETLYQDGNYDESVRYFSLFNEKFPQHRLQEEGRYGLAWAHFRQKNFNAARQDFTDFIKDYPNSPKVLDATIRLADTYRYLKDYTSAIRIYASVDSVAGKDERAEEARARLAEAFLEMGEADRAVGTYTSLVKYFPDSPRRDVYAFNIGNIYREREQDTLSIQSLENFVGEFPASRLQAQAHFIIGDAFYNLQQYDSANTWYRKVLDEFPNSPLIPEALDAVRYSLEGMGRGSEAVGVIDTFMVRNPSRIPADSLLYRKASILFDQGSYPEAIAMYKRTLDSFPASALAPDALFQMGRAYGYTGKNDSARARFQNVYMHYPESGAAEKAMLANGSLWLNSKSADSAVHLFEAFETSYPKSQHLAEVRYELAVARLQLKDSVAALATLQRNIDSSGGEEDDLFIDRSKILAARIEWARHEPAKALEILAGVVARRMDDIAAEGLLLRSQILLATNDLSGALAEATRLVSDFKTFTGYSEPGMLVLGSVYEKLTNVTAAAETYSALSQQTTDATLKSEAERRLKRLKK